MVSTPKGEGKTGEVARADTRLSAETYAEMESFDQAIQALQDAGIGITNASDDLGDGFEILEEKSQLVGVPFLILEARENPGEYGVSFTSLRVMTRDGRKLVVNDGGTGIHEQHLMFKEKTGRSLAGVYVPHGLRASDYRFCEDCRSVSAKGAPACTSCGSTSLRPAQTFYLDTSK